MGLFAGAETDSGTRQRVRREGPILPMCPIRISPLTASEATVRLPWVPTGQSGHVFHRDYLEVDVRVRRMAQEGRSSVSCSLRSRTVVVNNVEGLGRSVRVLSRVFPSPLSIKSTSDNALFARMLDARMSLTSCSGTCSAAATSVRTACGLERYYFDLQPPR